MIDALVILCATFLLWLRPEVPVTVWMAIVGPIIGARVALLRELAKRPPPAESKDESLLVKVTRNSGTLALFVGLGTFLWASLHQKA